MRDHTNQGRELALKVLRDESTHSPAFEARCRDLLERLQKLTHATVNRLRDVGRTEDGRVWLAWDLVRGETLRTVLEHRGALPPRRALEIARQILGGLEQGHSRGLVHGGV